MSTNRWGISWRERKRLDAFADLVTLVSNRFRGEEHAKSFRDFMREFPHVKRETLYKALKTAEAVGEIYFSVRYGGWVPGYMAPSKPIKDVTQFFARKARA